MRVIDSVIKNITKTLGTSLVVGKDELRDFARKHNRSQSLVYQALYMLRKKGLIYDWGDHVINIPILLACGYRGNNFDANAAVKILVKNGFSRDEATSIVNNVLDRHYETLLPFIKTLYEYNILWRTFINYLKHDLKLIDEIQQMFTCLLGLLVCEAKYMANVREPSKKHLRRLWFNITGMRLFAKDLASIPVSEDLLRDLGEAGRNLLLTIELISNDKNRLIRHYSRLFLKYTFTTVLMRNPLNNPRVLTR